MRVNLAVLRTMHPLLPETTAAEYVHRAALALQRRHSSGVPLEAALEGETHELTVHWPMAPTSAATQIDRHRVTEDGADAIALAVVHATRGWVVRRKLQRDQFADWLLMGPDRKLVAMEVSGTDDSDDVQRLREKVDQVGRCTVAGQRAACVVRFLEPRLTLRVILGTRK